MTDNEYKARLTVAEVFEALMPYEGFEVWWNALDKGVKQVVLEKLTARAQRVWDGDKAVIDHLNIFDVTEHCD